MKESDFKAKLVKWMREEGGYARRFEDQFAVGIPDMLMIPRNGRVYFVEAKMVRGNAKFGPTPRQFEELKRLEASSPHVTSVVAAFHVESKSIGLFRPALVTRWGECLSTFDRSRGITECLLVYYGAANANG